MFNYEEQEQESFVLDLVSYSNGVLGTERKEYEVSALARLCLSTKEIINN